MPPDIFRTPFSTILKGGDRVLIEQNDLEETSEIRGWLASVIHSAIGEHEVPVLYGGRNISIASVLPALRDQSIKL